MSHPAIPNYSGMADHICDGIREIQRERDELRQYAVALTGALEFYAEPSNYRAPANANPVRAVIADNGMLARAALAKNPEVKNA